MIQESPRSKQKVSRNRSGFTLLEVLITVAILTLLAGLVLAGVLRARRVATDTRVRDDLAMIANALDQYKDAFATYPQFADPATDQASVTANIQGNGTWLDYSQYRGAVLLCRCMIGPGNAGTTTAAAAGDDGADGPGFRTGMRHASPTNNAYYPTGKVYGPYLDAAKFKILYVNPAGPPTLISTPNAYPVIADSNGNAILYYPAAPGTPSVNLGSQKPQSASSNVNSRFNGYDNQGFIDGTSGTAPWTVLAAGCGSPPYLLWTAGQDGLFGLDHNGKTDDVANFDMPANLRK